MESYMKKLPEVIVEMENICRKIENKEEYNVEIKEYIPVLNQVVMEILELSSDSSNGFMINDNFVLQVLKDMLYGIANADTVYLLDVLRYGLLEVLQYSCTEYEKTNRG